MIFDYKVKYNGVHYPAGVDVPMEGETPKAVVETIKVEEKPKVSVGIGNLSVTSLAGKRVGGTTIIVEPLADGKYKYKVANEVSMPNIGQNLRPWSTWDGKSEITAESGKKICIAEVDADWKAVRAGITTVVSKP